MGGQQKAAPDEVISAGRPMRADARRNYDRLVSAAKLVFTEHGGGASMESVAAKAEVGVGTLYRHFPKRIDLVEAVYRNDIDDFVLATEKAEADLEPWPALVASLEAFVRYAQAKRTFLTELHEAFDKNPSLKLESRERLESAIERALSRAQEAGVVRKDIDGRDVMQLLAGMCTSATLAEGQGERLLGMILDGMRRP